MLEGLAAISLASSIVQFVDFGCKLLSAGYGAYKSTEGARDGLLAIETVCSDLEKLASTLAQPPMTVSIHQLSDDEKALQELSRRCQPLAKELLGIVKGLKAHGKGFFRAWDALRQELKRYVKAEKIKHLQDSLGEIRSEVGIRLLSITR